jgi:hypothetical protein
MEMDMAGKAKQLAERGRPARVVIMTNNSLVEAIKEAVRQRTQDPGIAPTTGCNARDISCPTPAPKQRVTTEDMASALEKTSGELAGRLHMLLGKYTGAAVSEKTNNSAVTANQPGMNERLHAALEMLYNSHCVLTELSAYLGIEI